MFTKKFDGVSMSFGLHRNRGLRASAREEYVRVTLWFVTLSCDVCFEYIIDDEDGT